MLCGENVFCFFTLLAKKNYIFLTKYLFTTKYIYLKYLSKKGFLYFYEGKFKTLFAFCETDHNKSGFWSKQESANGFHIENIFYWNIFTLDISINWCNFESDF